MYNDRYIFVPVSPSGTGNTFKALMVSVFRLSATENDSIALINLRSGSLI